MSENIFNITHRNVTYSFSVHHQELWGCCGIRLWSYLRLKDDLRLLDYAESTRTAVAKKLGEKMAAVSRDEGYGQMIASTIAEGCYNEIDNLMDYDPYIPFIGDDHLENFNLGTIMRAMGATPGAQTHNFNSGNEVITYTLDTTYGDRD